MNFEAKKTRLTAVGGVFILSLALNIIFFLSTEPPAPEHDAKSYDTIARLLIGLGPPDNTAEANFTAGLHGLFRRGFTYPALIAVVYKIVGAPQFKSIALLQAVILPITVLLTYLIGARIFDYKTGLLAAAFYALYLPAIWHTSFLLVETVLALLFALMMLLFVRFKHEAHAVHGVLFGVSLGIMGISHPIWLALPPLVVVALYFHYKKQSDRWPAVRKLIAPVAGIALVLGTWNVVRASYQLPQLGEGGTGFGAGGGFTFYVGSRAETRGMTVPVDYIIVETYFPPGRLREVYGQMQKGDIVVEPILSSIIAEKLASVDPNDWVLTDFDYYRAGIENWLDKPWQIPYLVAVKTYWYLLDVATSPTYPLPYSVLYTQWWREVFKVLNWPLLILMLVGFGVVWKLSRDKMVFFVPLAFQIVVVIITYPDNRYKYPCLSALFLSVAVGAYWSVQTLRAYRFRKQG